MAIAGGELADETAAAADRRPDEVDLILEAWRHQRPDLDPTPMGVFGRITRMANKSQVDLAETLAPYGLTPASFDVLANLRRSEPHQKTPGELAVSSMISTGGMTFRIDKLAEAGLVEREPSAEDRRVVNVRLTEKGRTLMDEVIEVHLARKVELLSGLSAEETQALCSALAKLEATWPQGH